MEITGTTINPIEQQYTSGTSGMMNVANEGGAGVVENAFGEGGDEVNFSPMALSLAGTTFSAGSVTTKLGNDSINYNNTTGVVTWNGQKLNLTGIGNPATDDMTFQKAGAYINVYKGSDSYRLNLVDGSQVKDANGDVMAASRTLSSTEGALFINKASNGTGGDGDDVIINTLANATIDGGKGKDKIFNFATSVTSITGGEGENYIYTVGLTAGTITTGTDTAGSNLKIVGNMTGGTINLGKGDNEVDATGYSLSNVTVNTDAASKNTITAKDVSGTNAWKLLGTENTLTVSTLDLTGTTGLEFGTGENNLTASLAKGTITDKGKGTHTIKTMDGATLNAEDSTAGTSVSITGSAKGATFKMGTGANEINAVGKVLDSVTITDKAVGASTNVMAGSLIGTSTVTLKGNTTVGSSVNVSGTIKGATIDTGAGIGTVTAGSVADSNIKMDMGGADATRIQTLIVKGNVSNTNLDTGAGDDYVSIGGTVTGGTFKLYKAPTMSSWAVRPAAPPLTWVRAPTALRGKP